MTNDKNKIKKIRKQKKLTQEEVAEKAENKIHRLKYCKQLCKY